MGLFDGTPLERPVHCEACGLPVGGCDCTQPVQASAAIDPKNLSPRVRRERRRGKWSTVVYQLGGDTPQLKALAKTLKHELSVGGGVTDGEIVLQGDNRDAVVERLQGLGYRAKAAGG